MLYSRDLLSGKGKYLFGSMLLLFVSVICLAFSLGDGNDFETSRREVLLRRIGHEILLQSGDSTSRVLPVTRIADNEYQIRFENEFTFRTDSLMNTTRRLLVNDPVASDYVVNVLNSDNSGVTYGYAISKNKADDIITCKGRKQPVARYMINVKFKSAGITRAVGKYFLGSLPFLAFVGFIFYKPDKNLRTLPESNSADIFVLGRISFDIKNRRLVINDNSTDLTGTETRLLRIFAELPNETIERSRLQKEIWEDEGVIVGRSLDMFISKLRKKLEPDASVNILVIRGKGYKLQIGKQVGA